MMKPVFHRSVNAGRQPVLATVPRIPLRTAHDSFCLSRTISVSAWAAERVSSRQQNERTPL